MTTFVLLCLQLLLLGCSSTAGGDRSVVSDSPRMQQPLKQVMAVDTTPVVTVVPEKDSVRTVTIAMVGDLMLGSNNPAMYRMPPNDGKDLLRRAAPVLKAADVAFGNLEGVLMTDTGTSKQCKDPKVCYAFKSPDHYVEHFVEAGIDVMSTANNHIGDFGARGRSNTKKVLKTAGIAFAGMVDKPYDVFERDGVKYGFCAFAPNSGTVPLKDLAGMARIVRHLDTTADIVIVSFHGGAEGTSHSHITRQQEIFLGEDRGNPHDFARKAIDAGADVVIGHGPHVPRAIDVYKGRFIAYSLGNFATYGFSTEETLGLAPVIRVRVDRNGGFLDGSVVSFRQEKNAGPKKDPAKGALKEIRRLTESDVPEAGIVFEEDGGFHVKKTRD